jgi:pimeloyl-ACP methyl ester carboxylesterase/DNA-binding winged helix-turn-helix (wHTH) protein
MQGDVLEHAVHLNGFVLDARHGELRNVAGGRVALRAQALAVLQCLARNADRVVGKDELMQTVWRGVVVTDDSLVQCIKELRRALGDDQHHVIETEPKRGYRLVTGDVVSAAQALQAAQPVVPFTQDIRFATSADGVRIAFAVSGEGPMALVRAPHWMTHLEWDWSNAVYGPWVQALSRRYRLVRYDGRGWGLSDRGIDIGTLDDSVHDLEAVVDAAGLERFALFGRSQGGAISIRYAARHPDRVSHLLCEGAYARGALRRGDQSVRVPEFSAFCRLLEAGWGRDNAAFRQLITSLMFPGATAEQMQAFNQIQRVACSPQDAARIQRAMAEFDATADLDDVRCPTLVMHSPNDARVPFHEGRLIASRIRGARFEPFDSRNHTPLPGEPAFEQVNRLIDTFLLGSADLRPLPEPAAPRRPALRAVTTR